MGADVLASTQDSFCVIKDLVLTFELLPLCSACNSAVTPNPLSLHSELVYVSLTVYVPTDP